MARLSEDAIDLVLADLSRRSRDEKYKWNPVGWAIEVLGVELWSKQREILQSIVDNKLTAVMTCPSVGKTFVAAIAACWWVSTRNDAIVQTTAPTARLIHDLLWAEMRKMHAKHGLKGYITSDDRWLSTVHGARTEVAIGSKPPDGKEDNWKGTHRDEGVLAIIDEAGSVPGKMFEALDSITTKSIDRGLAISNPDRVDSQLYEIFNNKDGTWNLIRIAAADTPNFTGEKVSPALAESLPSPEWAEGIRRNYGEDSSMYIMRVLAQFPKQNEDAMFSNQAIYRADDTEIDPANTERPIFGVDVAAGGANYTVVYGNWGGHVRQLAKWNESDFDKQADMLVELAEKYLPSEIRVDVNGIGLAVFQRLVVKDAWAQPHLQDTKFIRMYGSEAARNKSYRNARTENFIELHQAMREGLIDIDPDDEALHKQMRAIKLVIDDSTTVRAESKKEMRKRNVPSPDELDAVVYATARIDDILDSQGQSGKHYENPLDVAGELPYFFNMIGYSSVDY